MMTEDGPWVVPPDEAAAPMAQGSSLLLETSLPGVFAAGDVRHGSVKRVASAVGEGATTIPLVHRYPAGAPLPGRYRGARGHSEVTPMDVIRRPLVPGMRRLLFTAAVLVLLAGIQLFVFTGQTGHFFAFTIANPLAAAFLGAAYWAALAIEALAGRQALWANARIAVPAVLVFTVLTLTVTLTHLGQFHLGAEFPAGTQIVTVAWIAIYVVVPALLVILLGVQARAPGADPPRSAGLPAWLYVVLALQAAVLLGLGVALFAAPGPTAPLWPWRLTPMMAQATGAWLIALGVAAGHALLERDARRLRPAAAGYILLAVLLFIALARYPHQFEWGSASGRAYLLFLATMLLAGAVGLARGYSARSARADRACAAARARKAATVLASATTAGEGQQRQREMTGTGPVAN
jgi:hypothetical protein